MGVKKRGAMFCFNLGLEVSTTFVNQISTNKAHAEKRESFWLVLGLQISLKVSSFKTQVS